MFYDIYMPQILILFIYYLFDFIYLFLGRGGGREKEKERNINGWEKRQSVASCMDPHWGLASNPGICLDQELNQQPFTLWDKTMLNQLSHASQGYLP